MRKLAAVLAAIAASPCFADDVCTGKVHDRNREDVELVRSEIEILTARALRYADIEQMNRRSASARDVCQSRARIESMKEALSDLCGIDDPNGRPPLFSSK